MKTEKEKMLDGEIYNCGDRELLNRWHTAKHLLKEYAAADTRDRERLDEILGFLLGGKGKNIWLTAPFYCDYGENIYIGNDTEINAGCVFLDCNRIVIGNQVLIGPAVQIYTAFHPLRASDRLPEYGNEAEEMNFCKSLTAPVRIGDKTWIGGGAIILPGVNIGSESVIGAGSVVTKNIPEKVLAVGNPARVIRKL